MEKSLIMLILAKRRVQAQVALPVNHPIATTNLTLDLPPLAETLLVAIRHLPVLDHQEMMRIKITIRTLQRRNQAQM